MIKVEVRREDYRNVVVVTVDEGGVEGLRHAVAVLPTNPAVQSVEMDTGDSSPLHLQYEPRAEREQREKQEAEDRARYAVEREERQRELAGVQPKPLVVEVT